MKKTYQCSSVGMTEGVGQTLGRALSDAKVESAVIAMYGEMGVGKTAFTRGFARAFSIPGVKSPTYTVVNEYRGLSTSIYHFDMYRIEGEDDLYSIGFDEYLSKRGYCVIKWSENIDDLLPKEKIKVTITRTDDSDGRKIEIDVPDECFGGVKFC